VRERSSSSLPLLDVGLEALPSRTLVKLSVGLRSSAAQNRNPANRDRTTSSRSAISNQNNKARLQLLEKREELLEKVFDEAKAKLGEVTKDEKKYAELLKNLVLQVRPGPDRVAFFFRGPRRSSCQKPRLILFDLGVAQALYTLMEKDITVSGRPKDQKLLQKAVEEAASEFKDKAGFEVQYEVDDKLGDKSCVLASLSGFSLQAYVCNPTGTAESSCAGTGLGSRSTTRSTNGCGCCRSGCCPRSASRSLARTRTGGSTLERWVVSSLSIFFLSVFVPPCVSRRVSLCNSFYFPDAMDPGRKGGRSSRIFGSASKQAGDGVPLLLSGGEREKKVSECSFLRSL
jgi:hypothetical protein